MKIQKFGLRIIFLPACLLILGACAAAPRSSSDPARDIAIEEDIPIDLEDPATLPPAVREDSTSIPEEDQGSGLMGEGEFPAANPILREVDRLDQPAPIQPREPTVTTPVAPSTAVGVRGYRIQLLALSSRPEAESAAKEARQRLGIPVYLEFEPPHHKLRAGDFLDRAEALRWRDRARELGYEGAWVATTTIRPKAAGTP